MPQLVASSGTSPFQLPSQPPPARIGSEPPEPPFIDMPPGVINEATQVAALPGMPLPVELCTFQAPEPTGGKLPGVSGLHPAVIDPVWAAKFPRFWPAIATLESGDNSPNTGARNDVPQVPRMVRSSIGAQLNATFGLLVPLTSVYWS